MLIIFTKCSQNSQPSSTIRQRKKTFQSYHVLCSLLPQNSTPTFSSKFMQTLDTKHMFLSSSSSSSHAQLFSTLKQQLPYKAKAFVFLSIWFVNRSKLKSHSVWQAASEKKVYTYILSIFAFHSFSRRIEDSLLIYCSLLSLFFFFQPELLCAASNSTKNHLGRHYEDEDEEPRCVQLTNQHKGAIRFIRKVNCHHFTIFRRRVSFTNDSKLKENDILIDEFRVYFLSEIFRFIFFFCFFAYIFPPRSFSVLVSFLPFMVWSSILMTKKKKK